jgi:hypothetical protein
MALTTGLVQSLTINTSQVCVTIGDNPSSAELLVINVAANSDAASLAVQSSMTNALSAALVTQRSVSAAHGDQDAVITRVEFNPG